MKRKGENRMCLGALMAVVALIAATLLCGCTKTVYVPAQSARTEYVYADTAKFMAIINSLKEEISQKETRKESLIHKEKETVTLNENGDTIFRDRFIYIHLESEERSEYERIIKAQKDSLSDLRQQLTSIETDTIRVPYPVEKTVEIEKPFPWWSKLLMLVGILALSVAVAWLARKFRR